MADSARERSAEQTGLPAHAVLAEENKAENLVTSGAPVVAKCEQGEEGIGTQSLPQTYRASPPLAPPAGHMGMENLPQTAITTMYATIAQPSYGSSEMHQTLSVAGHRSYLGPDVSISSTDALPEQLAYVSGSVPGRGGSATVVAQANYILAAEPIDFRRTSVSHAGDVSRLAGDGDTERGGVALSIGTGHLSVPHTGDVTSAAVPPMESLARVTLPQTADIGRLNVAHDHLHRGIVYAGTVSRTPVINSSKIGASEKQETSTRKVNLSAEAVRMNEPNMRNTSALSVLDSGDIVRMDTIGEADRSLSHAISRGGSQDATQVRMGMPRVGGVSGTLMPRAGRLLPGEQDEVWIGIPVGGQSVPLTDMGKMNMLEAGRGSKMVVSHTTDRHAVDTLNTCEAGAVPAQESGNVRTVVMSQVDDFGRISLPNTGGVVGTLQHDEGGRMDTQTTGAHGIDIKYSDLIARNSLADVNRVGVLHAHEGCAIGDERLSLSQMQESSEVSAQHIVDTKPIILPQTGDISIVSYPHGGEGVGTMAVSQTGNISMVILPQTSDVGQMSTAQSEVRRIDLFPADEGNSTEIQTVDGSRMNIQHNGNVIRISLPAPDDLNRWHLAHADGTNMPLHQAEVGRTILPQTSDIRSAEVEDKVDVSKLVMPQAKNMGAIDMHQKYDVSTVIPYPSGGLSSMRATKAGDVSAVETQQTYSVRTNQPGELGAAKRQFVLDVSKVNTSQVGEVRSADRLMYPVETVGVSQAGDIVVTAVSQAGNAGVADQQPNYGVGAADGQQVYDSVRGKMTQAVNSGTAENQQLYTMGRAGLTQAGDRGAADRPHTYASRADPSQPEARAVETTASHRGSVPHTQEASLMRMHLAGEAKPSAAYTDSNMMTLPQTSAVRVVSVPCSENMVETGGHTQLTSYDMKSVGVAEQPHPEYINMRVMAEAAEIISRGSVPADDINMRLMAETADFVSRNVAPSTVKNTAGSLQQTQDISAKIVTGTGDSSRVRPPQTDTSAEVMPKSSNAVEILMQQVSGQPANENRTLLPQSVPAEVISASLTRTVVGKPAAGASQKAVGEKWKQRGGVKSDKGRPAEQPEEVGFRTEFLRSQSYTRWRDIGNSQGLTSDEEIACFLMKYYDDTSGMFPSGRSTCCACQGQLTMSCVTCSQKATGNSQDGRKDGQDGRKDGQVGRKDGKKEKKGGDDRTKLWKLIVEAAPKEKEDGKGKEDKEKRHRRKPRQTRRVLRRRVIVSPSRSSDDDTADDQDTDTYTNESPLPAKVHFEEEKKNTPTPMVTRKRGRPSNDSYRQVSTLQCSGCLRKFHTTVGLDQHIKRKRCKVSRPSGSVSEDKDFDKSGDQSLVSSPFKCGDCSKEYRSKQGLMLHRVAKHGEVNEELQMELSEGDDGEDTDEYVPDPKDDGQKPFECSVCHKEYRSKQGLLMHRASKHSEAADSKVKSENEGESSVTEGGAEPQGKGVESFKCSECKKTYSSRPGYMLHMKTKHFPMILRDCPECNTKFKTKVELRIHIRREHHKGKLILFCPYCTLIFHGRDALRAHMDDTHKTCRRVLFDCVACDLQFSSRIERKRHIQSEHKGKDTSLTCHFCGCWFATRHEFDEHERAGHPEQTQEWLCAICGDSFPTRYLLQRHALTHKEKILCSLCNKYITEPCYDDHMKRHYGNKTWKCEMCTKSFIRKAELQQHILVHKDERPFCCELCGMRYREKSRLNSHMRTHTGVKPYKCQQCEKCFTRSRELKNHMRVHTGEKPFACSVCGRKFASSGNLSAHRRKVHKLEPIPHGQQSRKHTLEESIKPENQLAGLSPPEAPPASLEAPAVAHSSAAVKIPVAHSAASFEGGASHSVGGVEAPAAHSAPLPLQAPTAHQAPAAHQTPAPHQEAAVLYQQPVVPKYEPLVSQPDHYIPQTVVQQSQPSLAIYWPNASYGEEA